MRTHRLGSLLVGAGGVAFSLVVTLSLPWYGNAPAGSAPASNLDRVRETAPRWLTEHSGITAWNLGGPWAMAVAGLAVLSMLAILLCTTAATEAVGRSFLQLFALAATGLGAWRLIAIPEGMEPRHGVFATALAALTLLAVSQSVAAAPARRRPPPVRRYEGARPAASDWERAHSYAPPRA